MRREELRTPLAMMVVVGTLSFNFLVLLPLFAADTWNGTATSYALLTSAMGVGAVAGALAAGARGRVGPRALVWSAAAFGVAELAVAAAPTFVIQMLLLIPLGAISVTFAAGVNASLQLAAPGPAPRARDGALLDRFSRLYADRRPAGRSARRGPRTPPRAGGRRHRRARGRAGRSGFS